ncbi:hypothetical protein T07_6845 [Trichinella nelsoni]|uniref:Uncharacterized protein n=1 Tax=Trichinella nelsoni TaxID=6336 RepID=A0A0V0RAD4_9BILA|nr:hypothetical protein T07_6845 [Trichinella nelsoni]
MNVIANLQQQNLRILFDVANSRSLLGCLSLLVFELSQCELRLVISGDK